MSERYIMRENIKNFDNFDTEICHCHTELMINNSNPDKDEVNTYRDIEIVNTDIECPECHRVFHLKRQIER